MMLPGAWRCDAHQLWTTSDCPDCDDELIALTAETDSEHFRACGSTMRPDEPCKALDSPRQSSESRPAR